MYVFLYVYCICIWMCICVYVYVYVYIYIYVCICMCILRLSQLTEPNRVYGLEEGNQGKRKIGWSQAIYPLRARLQELKSQILFFWTNRRTKETLRFSCYVYTYIYIHIYIYTYTYTYTHIHIHIHMHLKSSKQNYYIISLSAIIKVIFTMHIYA